MTSPTKPNPVIFIHGLWIHADAWCPWIELFESHGYRATAPGWLGDGATVAATRENPDALNDVGIKEMVDHYVGLIGATEPEPIAVGHSFGGLIAQELLAAGVVAAAAAIDPAPIKGVKALPYAQLKSAFPVLKNPANLHRTVSLTPSRPPTLPRRQRQLLPPLAGQGRHTSRRTRAAATDRRHGRPRRPPQSHPGSFRQIPTRILGY